MQCDLGSTVGTSHKRLLTAAIQPANELSFALDPCSDSFLLGVSAVRLYAPPGLLSGSPIFLFFRFASGSSTIFSTNLNFNCITLVHNFLFNSCSAFLCVLPNSKTTWAPCNASVLVQNVVANTLFLHVCHSPTHPFVGLLVPAACSLLLHSTDCQHADSGLANSKHCHLPDVSHSVSSLHLLASTAEIHRCGQACRQKTPRVHLMFNLAPCSE